MDLSKLQEAASIIHNTFGEASPIAMKLFAMQRKGEPEQKLSEFLGTSVANGQVPLSQLANIAELLQAVDHTRSESKPLTKKWVHKQYADARRLTDKKIQQHYSNMNTKRKRAAVEKVLRDPAMNKKSNHAVAKMIQVAPATVAKVRKEMEKSGELPRMEKIEVERKGKIYKMKAKRKNPEEEQLDRAVEIVETKIEFKPYGTGMVRVDGIPDNGIHRSPILIDEHVSSKEHKMGPAPSSKYDVTPILSCIFHRKDVHGISNRHKLQKFSESISELRFFLSQIKHGMSKKRATERILKIAYILNSECVMGLPTK